MIRSLASCANSGRVSSSIIVPANSAAVCTRCAASPGLVRGIFTTAGRSYTGMSDLHRRVLGRLIGWIISIASAILLFLLLYKILPNRPQGWKQTLPGALMAAVLFFVILQVFPLYLAGPLGVEQEDPGQRRAARTAERAGAGGHHVVGGSRGAARHAGAGHLAELDRAVVGGRLVVDSTPGQGTRLEAEVPVA